MVVPTPNRPDHVSDCAKSVIADGGFDGLLFVDQCDGSETAERIAAITDTQRAICIRSDLPGATNGRNVGIENTSGLLMAFTDDDWRVAPNWCESIRGLFASDPRIAVVCGRVDVAEDLPSRVSRSPPLLGDNSRRTTVLVELVI